MRLVLLFCCLALISPSFSQIPDAELPRLLDSLLKTKAPAPNEPGFAVCIVKNGGIFYEKQFGMADLERQVPMSPTTVFSLGSVSKQFTAAAIMLLEEQGKLLRSDPIHKYIPELSDFGHPITIDQLIAHTSGIYSLPEVLSLQSATRNNRLTMDYLLKWLRRHPVLAFEPGTNFSYSNSGYMLLYLIIERASGMPAAEYMKRHLFEPLGMGSACVALRDEEGISEGNPSYSFSKRQFRRGPFYVNAIGATGVYSNLRDLAAWQINFEHNRLGKGKQDWVQNMITPYPVASGASTHYGGALISKNYQGIPTIEHSGGWNNWLVQCRRFPEQNISVIVAANNHRYSPFPIADAICDVIFDVKSNVPLQSSNLQKLPINARQLEGAYLSFKNQIRHIRLSGDTLRMILDEGPRKTDCLRYLPEESNDTLLVFSDTKKGGYPLRFRLDAHKNVKGFYWEGGGYFVMDWFYEKLDTTAVEPQKWTGRYKSKVFKRDITMRIKRRTGKLRLKPVFFLSYPLERITDSVFVLRDGDIVIRFVENQFVFGDFWVNEVVFERKK